MSMNEIIRLEREKRLAEEGINELRLQLGSVRSQQESLAMIEQETLEESFARQRRIAMIERRLKRIATEGEFEVASEEDTWAKVGDVKLAAPNGMQVKIGDLKFLSPTTEEIQRAMADLARDWTAKGRVAVSVEYSVHSARSGCEIRMRWAEASSNYVDRNRFFHGLNLAVAKADAEAWIARQGQEEVAERANALSFLKNAVVAAHRSGLTSDSGETTELVSKIEHLIRRNEDGEPKEVEDGK